MLVGCVAIVRRPGARARAKVGSSATASAETVTGASLTAGAGVSIGVMTGDVIASTGAGVAAVGACST
jgi:hypothetical protein